LTKVEENTIKLAATVPQFGSRLPKQFPIPRDTGLLGHITTGIFLSHRAKSTNTILRGVPHNFRLHLFCLHISTVRSVTEVILTQTFETTFKAIVNIEKIYK